MTKKTVIILWSIALILAAGVATLKARKGDSGEAKTNRHRGETVMPAFAIEQVATIQIKGAVDSVTLTKGTDGWIIKERNNYPANFGNINNLMRTLETVKINNAIEAGPTYGSRFGMDLTSTDPAKHGIQMTFTRADQSNVATLFLGKDSGGGGRYIQNAADTSGIYVVNESFPTASANPRDWLDDKFISVEKITSIAITSAGKPDQLEWKLTRPDETAEFVLDGAKNGEKLDTNATSALKSLLSSARFQDVSNAEPTAVEQAPQRRIATIGTKDGFTYTFTLLEKPALKVPDALAAPDSPPPPAEETFQMMLKVDATFPTERTKTEGETPEDAKSKDDEFQASLKKLQEKLKSEQAFQGRIFEITKSAIDSLLKNRSELLQAPQTGTEATTPPISIDQ
jgi:hypothetical protein